MALPSTAGADAKRLGELAGYARRLLRSPALGAAAVFTAGGIGFAVANILLARVMSRDEFGELTLFLAMTQLALSIGPLGLEITINRHRLDASRALLARAAATNGAVGAGLAAFAALVYHVGFSLALCLSLAAAAAGINRVAAAFLQSHGRFGPSLALLQVHNYVLAFGVPLLWLLDRQDALPVAALIAAGYAATSCLGWWIGGRLPARSPSSASGRAPFREGLAAAGIGAATQLLWQLERLMIPRTLSVAELGTYAVLAAIAGSPFRMMQTGVGYTLLPGLRACRDKAGMRRLLRRETAAVCVVAAVAVGAVFVLTPLVMERVLAGRYEFSLHLLVAVVIVGMVKLWNGFAGAMVPGLGTAKDMGLLNAASWAAVALGTVCALWGSAFGLTGIVYGVGFAWFGLALVGSGLSIRAMRRADPGLEAMVAR